MTRDPFAVLLRGLSWTWIAAYTIAAVALTVATFNRGELTPFAPMLAAALLAVICAPAVLILRYLDPVYEPAPVRRLDDLDA